MPPPKKTKAPARNDTPDVPGSAPDSELALVRALAQVLTETSLTEIEIERQGLRVRVSRGAIAASPVHQHVQAASSGSPAPAVAVPAEAPAAPAALSANAVKSPMVGTAYSAPGPGTPDFIEVGSQVKVGQTLFIIEAMKTLNQIPSPRAGRVSAILIGNAQPVEFGEPLCVID